MATTMEETSSIVKDLIQINNDRYNGFMKAAEDVDDSSLKDLFNRLGKQSNDFKSELMPFAAGVDMDDTTETSVGSKLHRTWIDIKQAITGKDRHTILQSCEYGEDQILHTYKDTLQKEANLPADLRTVVQRQESQLQEAHDMIKGLRDSKMN